MMDAAGVMQIVATLVSITGVGIGLWVRMHTVVKRETDHLEAKIDALVDKLQQTRDELSEYKLRATETFAHHSRLSDIENKFLAYIREVREGQSQIQRELARLTSTISALDERMSHVEKGR